MTLPGASSVGTLTSSLLWRHAVAKRTYKSKSSLCYISVEKVRASKRHPPCLAWPQPSKLMQRRNASLLLKQSVTSGAWQYRSPLRLVRLGIEISWVRISKPGGAATTAQYTTTSLNQHSSRREGSGWSRPPRRPIHSSAASTSPFTVSQQHAGVGECRINGLGRRYTVATQGVIGAANIIHVSKHISHRDGKL